MVRVFSEITTFDCLNYFVHRFLRTARKQLLKKHNRKTKKLTKKFNQRMRHGRIKMVSVEKLMQLMVLDAAVWNCCHILHFFSSELISTIPLSQTSRFSFGAGNLVFSFASGRGAGKWYNN